MLSSYRSGVAVMKRALISVGFAPPIAKGVQNPGVRYSPEHPDTARSRAPVAPRSGLGPLTAADSPIRFSSNHNGVAVRKRTLTSVPNGENGV